MNKIKWMLCLLYVSYCAYSQDVTNINITKAIYEEVEADRIFEKIEIIPLETNENGLLNPKSATYYLTDKYIIGVNFLEGAYLFDRKTGAFIREISSSGQGPDQYMGILYNRYGFDEQSNILFASNGYQFSGSPWKCINIITNKVESVIKRPTPEKDIQEFSAYAPWRIKNNIYISYSNNRSGKDKVRLISYDKNGNIINKFSNYLEYDKKSSSFPFDNGIFYYYKGDTYFKERNYNDTVFYVDEKKMCPHIIFSLGDKRPSYFHQEDIEFNKGKYLIHFVDESDSYVLFCFTYFAETTVRVGTKFPKYEKIYSGYYDKRSRQTYISCFPDMRNPGYRITGIPVHFHPISLNANKEMISCIDPEELYNNTDAISAKYKYLVKNINEDDNPIVIIAKLK